MYNSYKENLYLGMKFFVKKPAVWQMSLMSLAIQPESLICILSK